MKRINCIILVCLFVLLTGCASTSSNVGIGENYEKNTTWENKEMTTLNSRQIEICKELELPTEYDELTDLQQKSIVRIEELLTYLDNKYNTTFHYLGYSQSSVLEDEWLRAYSDELNEYYFTTLNVSEDGSYSDDYLDVVSKSVLEIYASNYLNELFPNEFKVFALECRYNGATVPSEMSDFKDNASLTVDVFVKGKNNSNNLTRYADKLVAWYREYKIIGYVNFIMVSDEYFNNVTVNNFRNALINDETEISLNCDIYENGEYKIY